MRYLGNKQKLLPFIEKVIRKYKIEGEVFADLFAGTGVVGDYFKDTYNIIANDYMYYSSVISRAKLSNYREPDFETFKKKFGIDPFYYFNNKTYYPQENYFVYKNYSPKGNRMYFTEENAIKIDGIRIELEEIYKEGILDEKEYLFLLASLIESVPKISNTSGTYQAFFKFWESRSLKSFNLEPLNIFTSNNVTLSNNKVFNNNTNKLVREISGDIAYIDPPYTITQYTNSYHVLETIARYDYPEIFGKTGRRLKRELSGYSNKQKALHEFEDLFRQIQFKHIMISYSNQSIVPLDELIKLIKLFAVNNEVFVEKYNYREYATNNSSHKGNGEKLQEALIYFKKDVSINKSPLNYSGSKDVLIPKIQKLLPKRVDVFVDAMGGAFNVGANIVATNKVIYNEYNPYVFGIVKMLIEKEKESLIIEIEKVIAKFNLSKKNKEAYLNLRNHYNSLDNSSLILFVLQIYAFQNMIRFNNSKKMNTPVGNNEFNLGTIDRIRNFKIKSPNLFLSSKDYLELDLNDYAEGTVLYFDPPYFITKAEYNDGKRGLEGWNAEKESSLLNFLVSIHQRGLKFMLSNVITHGDKRHHILEEWIDTHDFYVTDIGTTGIKYPRREVLITNYNPIL